MSWANFFTCNAWCYESRADVNAPLSENVNKILLVWTVKCLSVSNDTQSGSQPYWYISSKSLSLFWNINNINLCPLSLWIWMLKMPQIQRENILKRPIICTLLKIMSTIMPVFIWKDCSIHYFVYLISVLPQFCQSNEWWRESVPYFCQVHVNPSSLSISNRCNSAHNFMLFHHLTNCVSWHPM